MLSVSVGSSGTAPEHSYTVAVHLHHYIPKELKIKLNNRYFAIITYERHSTLRHEWIIKTLQFRY